MSAVVVIGNFDGVHRGHLALIARARAEARPHGAEVVALTFDPHPAAVLRPDAVPAALQSIEERVASLLEHGCDRVEVLPFDHALAAMTPEAFVSDLIVGRLGAAAVVVGENFRFGAGAVGDVELLTRLGAASGVRVHPVGLVAGEDGPVSSSALRALLAAGDLAAFARGLGRPFALEGEVVHGDGRGRTLGIPTANVAVGQGRALPADGVYACWAEARGVEAVGSGAVPAVVNVGLRPTFSGSTRTVEAHLLVDGAPDLYGRRLRVTFVGRLRGEERFDGVEALLARIRVDIATAREVLGTPTPHP